ncbi:MAG TPA: trigger factor [Sphingobacteriaceae bacterium]|nr:trigger factor [Sphingobacteriaceae bacterium]
MDITQEKIDNLNSVIKVALKPQDYQARVEKAIKVHAKKAQMPGFRPGMVPASHIKKMYGRSILVDEINHLLSDTLNNYILENNLEVLGQPLPKADSVKEFKWDYNDEFEFDYEIGIAPEFALDLSSKDTIPHYTIKVDDETLASRIVNLRKSYGKMSNPDVSADNDVLFSELKQLSPDGSIFEEGITHTASIRIDLVKDENIKKSLIGLKKDDVIEFDIQKAFENDVFQISKLLNISEEDTQELRSKFQLTVKNINRLDESDLDQEFFDKLFGKDEVKTEEEFRTRIKGELETMMVQNADQKLQSDIHKYVSDKVSFQLPDEFLKRWLKTTSENLSDEDLENGYADFANNLKWTLIQNKIIKENNIQVKNEEIFLTAKKHLDNQFRMYSQQALPDDQLGQYAVQFLQNKENASRIIEELKTQHVIEYLKSVVTLDNREIQYNKFLELA